MKSHLYSLSSPNLDIVQITVAISVDIQLVVSRLYRETVLLALFRRLQVKLREVESHFAAVRHTNLPYLILVSVVCITDDIRTVYIVSRDKIKVRFGDLGDFRLFKAMDVFYSYSACVVGHDCVSYAASDKREGKKVGGLLVKLVLNTVTILHSSPWCDILLTR